jgi:hypothetical protein
MPAFLYLDKKEAQLHLCPNGRHWKFVRKSHCHLKMMKIALEEGTPFVNEERGVTNLLGRQIARMLRSPDYYEAVLVFPCLGLFFWEFSV